MTTDLKLSSCGKDFNVFKTSAERSSDKKSLDISEEKYFVSVPIVLLNSTKVLDSVLSPFFKATNLS